MATPIDALRADRADARIAEIAAPLARFLAIGGLLIIPLPYFIGPGEPAFRPDLAALASLLFASAAFLVHKRHARAGAWVIVGTAFALITATLLASAGQAQVLFYGTYAIPVLAAALMLGLRAAAATVAASILVCASVAFVVGPGSSTAPISALRAWVLMSLLLAYIFTLLWISVRSTRRRESELHVSEARFRALADSAPDLIAELGPDGDTYYISPSHQTELGHAVEELERGNPMDLLHPDDREKILALGGMAAEGEEETSEWRVRRSDGEYRTYAFRLGRFTTPDGSLRLVTFGRDMTRHYELQRQLVEAQRMEAVGRIAGGIAHDFNNYLTVILGSADWLAEELPKHTPLSTVVEDILDAGRRSADLTRQLLAFARRQALQPQVVDLNELLGSMDSLLRRVIPSNIEIATVRGSELGGAMIDRSQFEQVILNLAINARDAMPDGGRLTIETGNAFLDAASAESSSEAAEGRHVVLAVTDTGSGIPADDLQRIFEPFYSTKGPGSGTGLGLATVHGIVKQSGGSIDVYSEPDEGTTFKIHLPRVESEPEKAQVRGPSTTSELGGDERILVAEDDESVRRLIRRMLSASGYDVIEATDGERALALALEDAEICAILTDVMMPSLSGPALAERLAELRPELPIVFISGYTADGLVGHGIDARAPLVHKPFTATQLLTQLRSALDGRSET